MEYILKKIKDFNHEITFKSLETFVDSLEISKINYQNFIYDPLTLGDYGRNIITIDPLDALKASNEASTERTVPIISVWKFAAHPSSLGFPPPALTCGTRISKPPRSPIVEAIQVFKASPSATFSKQIALKTTCAGAKDGNPSLRSTTVSTKPL